MYVPAEAVYAEMVADGEEKALADACIEMRVYPVSPRLLYSLARRRSRCCRRARSSRRTPARSRRGSSSSTRLWERAEEPFLKVRGHLNNAQKQYDEAAGALNRFGAKLSGITEVAQEKLETVAGDAEALPLLPS